MIHVYGVISGLARTNVKGTMDELQLETGEDGLPFLTLVYGNGPGYAYHKTNGSYSGPTQRRDLREDEATGKTSRFVIVEPSMAVTMYLISV